MDQHKASARLLMQEEVQSRSGRATHPHHWEQVDLGFKVSPVYLFISISFQDIIYLHCYIFLILNCILKFDQPKLIIRPLIQEEDLSRTDPATKSIGQHFREHVDLEFQVSSEHFSY